MDEPNTQIDRGLVEGLVAAFRANPTLWNRPALPASVLIRGSLAGFSDEDAEIILSDHNSQVYLNELWGIYSQDTGRDLPPTMQQVIDKERSQPGPRLNVHVAHTAGYAFADDESFDSQIEQFMAAQPYSEDIRIPVGVRGSRGSRASKETADQRTTVVARGPRGRTDAEEAESGDTSQWDTYFLTQRFLILLRRKGSRLVGQVESAVVSGTFKLTLEWPNAVSQSVVVQIVRNKHELSQFSIDDASDGMPVKASIKAFSEDEG